MRNHLVLLITILILSSCRVAHTGYLRWSKSTDRAPFQVLESMGARLVGDDETLSRYDYVNQDNFIQVKENQHLILVHYSGKFLEFDADTVLNIAEVNSILKKSLSLSEKAKKFRPELHDLYSVSPFSSGVSITHYYNSLVFIDGNHVGIMEFKPEQVCLAWRELSGTFNGPYVITVKSVYDKEVATFTTFETSIQFDLSQYDSLMETRLAIIDVASKENPELSTGEIGVYLREELKYYPTACNLVTAIDALEFASYLRWHGSRHADDYFILAENLSDKSVYTELKEINVR